jgi:quercetin dioxygenase-like cupin family protein
MQRRTLCALLSATMALGLGLGIAAARTSYPESTVLFQGNTTVLGQKIAYPPGTPEVTGAIVTIEAGQSTGWHRHNAPLFAYMLDGELTVDYGPAGKRRYVAGDTLLEAIDVAHDGTNTGSAMARVLVVYIGAEGLANTTPMDPPN